MFIVCLAAMVASGTSLKAQEVTITLNPGWTWISYLGSEPQNISTVLGTFTPEVGDMISSQDGGVAIYRAGRWRGAFSQFTPGYGYKYYSARTMPVTLTFVSLAASQVAVTTAEPTGVTLYSFEGGGQVTLLDYDCAIKVFGLCWSTTPQPTVADNQILAGIGVGSFTWTVDYLVPNTTYYVRAYALTEKGMVYGEQKMVKTKSGIPELTTNEVTGIGMNQATCGGEITDDGGLEITARGICWSTSPEPTVADAHTSDGTGMGSFVSTMTGLTPNTTYYVRAYATNSHTTAYGEEMSFTTVPMSFMVSLSANPAEGGTVTGGGVVVQDHTCTVTATANTGYDFVNWTEDGNVVTTNPSYSFVATADRTLVTNFQIQSFAIAASADPTVGGTVSGDGTYDYGTSCTLAATPNTGYDFVNWTENGSPVSTEANYTFTVTGERSLVAHFQLKTYTVAATANPTEGGTVSGSGTYTHGQSCTVTATPNTGYDFVNWTENGNPVSANPTYTITVTSGHSLVANFQLKTYTVAATANPAVGGTISGSGTYTHGQSCTLTATPNTSYEFVNWTEDGTPVSTNPAYTFTVTSGRTFVAHFQLVYTVAATANPTEGGTVTGGGTYPDGQSCTLTATPNTGYDFVNWTEDGTPVSTNPAYNFTVTSDRTLVANFQVRSYTITVSANLEEGGTVTGGGVYTHGQSCTVTATVNTRFGFVNWTENDEEVSVDAEYTFTVTGPRSLVANFEELYPAGAINGLFSISASQQVYFSQGNLQYQASTDTWKFADNQYDYVGTANSNISSTYSGWIDLFGWGTSGWDNGNLYYQPWDWYVYSASEYGPPGNYSLTGSYANSDWGVYNPISNGGNQAGLWRTLTRFEWDYLINTRSTTSGIRFVRAIVNNANGIILLPDDWSDSTYTLNNTNDTGNYSINTISASQWTILESAGAVFLPAAGYRHYTSVPGNFSNGSYWTASCDDYGGGDRGYAYVVGFMPGNSFRVGRDVRYEGRSVRLVRVAE